MSELLTEKASPEGTVVGAPASGPVEPPEVLDPVALRRSVAQVFADEAEKFRIGAAFLVDEMMAQGVRGFGAATAHQLRWAAWRIFEAGGDPSGYVRYVAEQSRKRHRRKLRWQQVIGAKAIDAWLPEYTRGQVQARDGATYEATPERREEYAERMRQDQLP